MTSSAQDIHEFYKALHRHALGQGIAPLSESGAGFFSSMSNIARKAYNFVQPHLKKHAANFGRELGSNVMADLNKRLVQL